MSSSSVELSASTGPVMTRSASTTGEPVSGPGPATRAAAQPESTTSVARTEGYVLMTTVAVWTVTDGAASLTNVQQEGLLSCGRSRAKQRSQHLAGSAGRGAVKRVLFLCVENSNRSQMAEAYARMNGADVIDPVAGP